MIVWWWNMIIWRSCSYCVTFMSVRYIIIAVVKPSMKFNPKNCLLRTYRSFWEIIWEYMFVKIELDLVFSKCGILEMELVKRN